MRNSGINMKLPHHRLLIRAVINRLLIAFTNLEVAAKKMDGIGLQDEVKLLRDIIKQVENMKDKVKNVDIKTCYESKLNSN